MLSDKEYDAFLEAKRLYNNSGHNTFHSDLSHAEAQRVQDELNYRVGRDNDINVTGR